jgi:cyclopropane fatty-acyl-phospholipid synthase-like methyltransferase
MSYDETYLKVKNMFGSEPEEILVNHRNLIDKSKRVLDVGAGQGRNTFYLANNGFKVDAIDNSIVSAKTIAKKAKEKELRVKTIEADFFDFMPKTKKYSAIMVFGLLQILNWSMVNSLFNRAKKMLNKNGLLFVTAFGTKDDSYKTCVKNCVEIGKNSFYCGCNGTIRTYLEKDEILTFVPEFDIIHHFEGKGKIHKHGKGPFEQHYIVELVAKLK